MILCCRDHGGVGQGQKEDNGFESFWHDAKVMDIIHLDPWKRIKNIGEGAKRTADYIRFCYELDSSILFEVGTEQSIMQMSANDLNMFLNILKNELGSIYYYNIIYAVIQSGTSLKEDTNTGDYDAERLKDMLSVCKEHNIMSKEHNGDYLSGKLIREKFNIGLDAINIAPELGVFETQCLLRRMKDEDMFSEFYLMCYESMKWQKWVDNEFNPFTNKVKLTEICGHYVFNTIEFSEFKHNYRDEFDGFDEEVKYDIKNLIKEKLGG